MYVDNLQFYKWLTDCVIDCSTSMQAKLLLVFVCLSIYMTDMNHRNVSLDMKGCISLIQLIHRNEAIFLHFIKTK